MKSMAGGEVEDKGAITDGRTQATATARARAEPVEAGAVRQPIRSVGRIRRGRQTGSRAVGARDRAPGRTVGKRR